MSKQIKLTQAAMLRGASGGAGRPMFKHGRVLKRAAAQFRESFAELDSTKYAESMKPENKHF
jgi:hypothetical protein